MALKPQKTLFPLHQIIIVWYVTFKSQEVTWYPCHSHMTPCAIESVMYDANVIELFTYDS